MKDFNERLDIYDELFMRRQIDMPLSLYLYGPGSCHLYKLYSNPDIIDTPYKIQRFELLLTNN